MLPRFQRPSSGRQTSVYREQAMVTAVKWDFISKGCLPSEKQANLRSLNGRLYL
jgi:hypothetical protein